jgi:hypothetical protein
MSVGGDSRIRSTGKGLTRIANVMNSLSDERDRFTSTRGMMMMMACSRVRDGIKNEEIEVDDA